MYIVVWLTVHRVAETDQQ